MTIPTLRGDLVAAARDAAAVWLGLFALGVGLGVLVISHDLPWWLAPLISGTVYAGSVEFLLVSMLAVAAPVSVIALTTFMVNARHVFYGLSFPLHRVRGRAKAYSVFALTDEAYALVARHEPGELMGGRILWIQAGLHLSWISGATLGALVGATFLGNLAGLDFVLTALFIVLAMDAYRHNRDHVTVVVSAVIAVVAALLAGDATLLVAMGTFSAVSVARHAARRMREQQRGADRA